MELLRGTPLLFKAYREQVEVVKHIHQKTDEIIQNDPSIPRQFRVTCAELSNEAISFDRNIFSSFFVAALFTLPLKRRRMRLYATLNHLFRTWVTCADNLLDNEDKQTIRLNMPGRSHVMRQVVGIMLADRIMQSLLDDAVRSSVISREEAGQLSKASLRVLLPSAAEEGMEEGGLQEWPPPEIVLRCLHPLKTGILFNVTFFGPEAIETCIEPARLAEIKSAMMEFGVGCQILDDIRDMARDFTQRKANYLLSLLLHSHESELNRCRLVALTSDGNSDARLYAAFPRTTQTALDLATEKLQGALERLDILGMRGLSSMSELVINLLLKKLDLADVRDARIPLRRSA